MIVRETQFFLLALQFLTRIPVRRMADLPSDWLARSVKYMPLVGALIGLFSGVVLVASAALFPAPLPVLVGLGAATLLTGAIHEDGLADTAEALGGGVDRNATLAIMKDSRIGTFGTLALLLTFALKGAALSQIDSHSAMHVLIAGHAAARLAAVLTLSALPYADAGAAKVSRTNSPLAKGEIATAVVLGLIPGLLVLQASEFLIAAICAVAAATLIGLVAWRRIGGYTGDVLGAVEQVFETVFFMFAAGMIAGPG